MGAPSPDEPPDPRAVALGVVVRRRRKSAVLSQEELAAKSGLSIGTISNIERGIGWPQDVTIRVLANSLGLSVEALMAEVESEVAKLSRPRPPVTPLPAPLPAPTVILPVLTPPPFPALTPAPLRATPINGSLGERVRSFFLAMGYVPLDSDLYYQVGDPQFNHPRRVRVRVPDGAATDVVEFTTVANSPTGQSSVQVLGFDDLIDLFLNPDAYEKWLTGRVNTQQLHQWYVELACSDPGRPVADAAVQGWLRKEAREVFVVAGAFGTGKSWLAEHLAFTGLTAYTAAKKSHQIRPLLPLLVPLRDARSADRPEDALAEFVRQHQLGVTYPALRLLAQWGKVAVVFDGLDEWSSGHPSADPPSADPWETLGQLTAELPPPAKVIVTCRSEHLRTAAPSGDPLSEGRAVARIPHTLITLGKLDEPHIKRIAEKRQAGERAETIIRNDGLAELARRPLLLALLLDIDTAKLTDWRPTLAGAFAEIVRRKMAQDVGEGALPPHRRLGPLGDLAWVVLKSEKVEWAESFLDQVADQYQIAGTPERKKEWRLGVLGRTMLIPSHDGGFEPLHRSFLEFFAARKLVAELGVLRPAFVSLSGTTGTTRVSAKSWHDHRHLQPDEEVEGFCQETYPPDAAVPDHAVGKDVARVGYLTRNALQFAAQMIDPDRLDAVCEFARTFPGGDRWNALVLLPLVAAHDPAQAERIALGLSAGRPAMLGGVAWALGELQLTREAVKATVTDALKRMVDAVRTRQVSPDEYATAWWEAAFALEKITLGGAQNSQSGLVAIPLLTDSLPGGYDLLRSLGRLEAAMTDESKRAGVEFDIVVLLKELGAAKNQRHCDRFLKLLPKVQEDTEARRWQYYLVWLVGRLKRPEAATVAFLVAATRSKLNSVRGIAYEALGLLVAGSREHAAAALPVLCDGVRNDRYHRARAHAAAAIGELAGRLTTQQRTQAMLALSSALPVEEHKANEAVYHQSIGRLIGHTTHGG